MPLTGRQKSHLRGLGHHLHPVVMVGREGASGPVVEKVGTELEHHELIKVRIGDGCLETAAEIGAALAAATRSDLVQTIGHICLLYRRRAKDPEIVLPRPEGPVAGSGGRKKAVVDGG